MAQREPHVSIAVEAQPILRNRWTQRIPTEALETIALTGPRDNPGVQIEAAQVRMTGPGRDRLDVFGRLAILPNPRARPSVTPSRRARRRRNPSTARRYTATTARQRS